MELKELHFENFEELDDYIQCIRLNKLIVINTTTKEKCQLLWARYLFGNLERILIFNMNTHEIYYEVSDDDFDDDTFYDLNKYYKFYEIQDS